MPKMKTKSSAKSVSKYWVVVVSSVHTPSSVTS